MKAFLIIALAALVVISPILMLRPSQRERRLTRIRQLAREQRVQVQPLFLRRDPHYSATLERNLHLDGFSWARYQLVADEKQTGPSVKGVWVQRKTPEGTLVWEPRDIRQVSHPAVDALLANWSHAQKPDFLALELGPRSVSILWNEQGDTAEAGALCQQLQSLLQI